MTYLRTSALALSIAALAACGSETDTPEPETPETGTTETTEPTESVPPVEPAPEGRPAALEGLASGTYSLDQTHAYLAFKVVHRGLSDYRVSFTDFDADLQLDPDDLSASQITVTIDPMGLNAYYATDYKASHQDSPFDTWNEALSMDERFLDAGTYPEISFVSTDIETTGDSTGTVTGDLTFLGETRPVTMDVTFNGSTKSPFYGDRDLIGFTATTSFNRSDFGQDALQGPISDEVMIEFSGEFIEDEAPSGAPGEDETVAEEPMGEMDGSDTE